MDRDDARTALEAAARKRDEARGAYDAADEDLRQAMRDADAVGVSHVEIARRAGVHRNTVARVVGDTGRRDPGR
ncbi:hypothetical protein LQ327_20190 [Actinomycetospora endophytica]|uniref:Helix-turn-helix protein n=1 Tax=Actinomycetospora endophytica TaxID=2291215 RepID=A0ABS8PC14_9PSEU|nr:hypothetical protein [Actinomycetospora endophytica]MCD2195694.1 hypothetical protein [Actinomycetospora endophytica]